MSKFTTEVRYICEYYDEGESEDLNNVDKIVHNVHNQVIGEYPIFDEEYREVLNCKILKHYYTREICAESVGLWKLWLNNRMNEIMPYYNKMYLSELIKFNPMYDVDLHISHNKNENTSGLTNSKIKDARDDKTLTSNNGERNTSADNTRQNQKSSNGISENNAETSNTSTNKNSALTNTANNQESSTDKSHTDKYSDTPQGAITGLESGTYLTNARIIGENENNKQTLNQQSNSSGTTNFSENGNSKDTVSSIQNDFEHNKEKNEVKDNYNNSSNATHSTTGNNERNEDNNVSSTEAYLEYVKGKRGGVSYAKLLEEYRKTFLNIDLEIINKLEDLFFGLWE
ncbi:MAG: hypothetical protein J6T10_30665 [Methanobrevibacter sp.]|nr:hypothetical protein [Methanobrevibacter sp.]